MTPIQAYQLEVLLEEVEALDRQAGGYGPYLSYDHPEHPLHNKPHIVRLLASAPSRFLLQHLQNFIWTVASAMAGVRRVFGGRERRFVGPERSLVRPRLESESFDPNLLIRRPRIWLDITQTHHGVAVKGGIPRVCRELARAAVETGLAVPVIIDRGELIPYYSHPDWDQAIAFAAGDHFVIIDCFWDRVDDYIRCIEKAQAAGATTAFVVHDIIPIHFPGLCPTGFARRFETGLRTLCAASDVCVGVSQTTIEELAGYLDLDQAKCAYFHLGAELKRSNSLQTSRRLKTIFSGAPVILSVGTVEPKKGYPISLKAFEILWDKGIDVQFVMIAKLGWQARAFEERLARHPQAGRNLHRIDDATDEDLQFAYQHAHCFLQASVCEGFGLPVVEAAGFGLPIIASDIPVFREIAPEGVSYFPVCDAEALADMIHAALRHRPEPARSAINTWHDALRQLVAAVETKQTIPERP